MSQEIKRRRFQLLKKPSEAPLVSTIAVILQKYISIDKKYFTHFAFVVFKIQERFLFM